MLSNSNKLEILGMFARAESETNPEGKAINFLEAIDLTVVATEDEASPDELAWIADVRRSNCRGLIEVLKQMRNLSLFAWMTYSKVVRNLRQELREEVEKNVELRRVLDKFFAMHCPSSLAPRLTQGILGELAIG